MPAGLKQCASCGNDFQARAGAAYCSKACKQRAHRRRAGRNRNASTVTVKDLADERHSEQARTVLGALDAELATNAEQIGKPLEWSAAERAVLGLIGDTIDRRTDLQGRYAACDDGGTRLKLAAELRLMEAALARLLKQINTELPSTPSLRSQKASDAAHARWERASDQ